MRLPEEVIGAKLVGREPDVYIYALDDDIARDILLFLKDGQFIAVDDCTGEYWKWNLLIDIEDASDVSDEAIDEVMEHRFGEDWYAQGIEFSLMDMWMTGLYQKMVNPPAEKILLDWGEMVKSISENLMTASAHEVVDVATTLGMNVRYNEDSLFVIED